MYGRKIKTILVTKPDKDLKGTIGLPASKSISNRLLMIGAISGKPFPVTNLSEADDTLLLQKAIPCILAAGERNTPVEIDVANAGTVMRFLTAWLAMTPGRWVLTGSDRMKQRPVSILVEALRSLGASIDYLAKPGCPPILIRGSALTGGEVVLDPGVSSQFTSALLLIAPYLPGGLVLILKGKEVSSPYVTMTIRLMQAFGARVKEGKSRIHVKPGSYLPADFRVEADWSAAAFWYEAAALAENVDLELAGLQKESLQGDAVLPDIFQNFGVRTGYTGNGIRLTKVHRKTAGFYFDFNDYPDVAQAVITTCAGMGIRGHFEGLKSLQIKETDRLRALKNEIQKLGIPVDISAQADGNLSLDIKPPVKPLLRDLTFESFGDHRMAMAMAPLALKTGSLSISDPDVVAKSYPGFWHEMQSVGFEIHE